MKGRSGYYPPSILEEINKIKHRYNVNTDSQAMHVLAKHNQIAFEIEDVSKSLIPTFLRAKNNEKQQKYKQKNAKSVPKRRTRDSDPLSPTW
jgi:hypothetical protein